MRLGAIGGLAALGIVLVAGAPVRPAAAQMESREGIALQNQILELQREIEALQQQRAGGGYGYPAYPPPTPYGQPGGVPPATSDIVTSLLTRVDTLESALRDLRGQVQELANQLQQQSAQLNKRIDDLQFQIQNGAHGAQPQAAPGPNTSPPSAALSPAPSPAAPAKPRKTAEMVPVPPNLARQNPEAALREGDAALAQHNYTVAEADARAVLANRLSPRAAEAQYLLAQALLGEHRYSQAAIAFDDAYNRSRKGGHAQDSLLGLADSLIAINEKRAACDTLSKLRTEFPNERPDVRDRASQLSRRAGCH
jgi:TolA-binding protein